MTKGRQELFCVEYVNDPKRNQTQAAIRAGYSLKGAAVEASRMLRNPNILRRIKELEREMLEEAGYSTESLRTFIFRRAIAQASVDAADISQVIYENDERRQDALEQIADANGGQYPIDFGDALVYNKPTHEWTPEERTAVKSVKNGKNGVEVELYDKQGALKMLADMAGLTKADVSVNLSVVDTIAEARARAGVQTEVCAADGV